jgi:hypothetical protein
MRNGKENNFSFDDDNCYHIEINNLEKFKLNSSTIIM